MITSLADLRTRLFRITRSTTIILGINGLTRLLANELDAGGKFVSLIELENGASADGDAKDELVLERAGAKGASFVMAATSNDDLNLSLCRVARQKFGVPMVIARLGLLGGVTSWARLNDVGLVRMTWNDMVSAILGTVTPGRALARLARATDREQVAEVELLNPVFLGRTIADLALDGCEVLALRRNNVWMADMDLAELRRGDVLTLIGTKTTISRVRESFASL